MPYIGEYTDLIKVILGEAAKYFTLLLFAVLAVRLWRALKGIPAGRRSRLIASAGAVTALAAAIGYFSVCHSLSLLYSFYGMRAFRQGELKPALSLFDTALGYWHDADTVGKKGVCLLLLGETVEGKKLLNEARTLRKGRAAPFEQFHEGLYCFFKEKPEQATPFLEAAWPDLNFRWNATKLLAVIRLENGQTAGAARLMQPFLAAEIKEIDQAFVVAALKLAEGKTNEVRAILAKFPPENLSPFWKVRFEKLRQKLAPS
jgi:hypothetical protein